MNNLNSKYVATWLRYKAQDQTRASSSSTKTTSKYIPSRLTIFQSNF
jgi:hypothetical protein